MGAGFAGDPVGCIVRAPFGASEKIGVVAAIAQTSDQPEDKLKTAEPVPGLPVLPADWLELCAFCARYYHYPLGQVMAFALPPLLRRGKLPRAIKNKKKVDGGGTGANLPAATPDQQRAIDVIVRTQTFASFLLYGVTGSGKTEVYLCAIEDALATGGQVLMLVPEIALTPQLEERVSTRFPGANVVSAHSGVADAGRARAFLAALEGRADIVLGTRLSVFMPMPRLRLIVVDEEHDPSFKQQDGLRYSGRDVAVFRAKQRNIPIVLGSATPSLESFHHAQPRSAPASQGGGGCLVQRGAASHEGPGQGRTAGGASRYIRLELPQRAVANAMPRVATVDTRRQKLQDGLSQELIAGVSERLQRKEQSLVFLNRRGYAPVLACPACAWVSHCRRCAANLVLHLADRRLRCHHCGLEAGIPKTCPNCGNLDIQPFGRGTQRVEERLVALFPEAHILRIDRDSVNSPRKWEAVLNSIHAGEADILVGTQMLAKGHDFPNLTLVAAVGADAALFAADFRAPERLFAQLMQVGGRSGRHALPGEVLIQTEHPDHPLYQALIHHDYAAFAHAQLAEREAAGFPPFAFQALLRAEANEMPDALAFLKNAVELAQGAVLSASTFSDVLIYDPVPMRLARLKNRERAQLLVESKRRPVLHAFLDAWLATLNGRKTPHGLRWHLDVDPLEL